MTHPTRQKPRLVRFVEDDPAGLWRRGDAALDLGWESRDDSGNPTTDVRLLRLIRTGELLSLGDPYGRGLVEDPQTTKGKGS
jgi:hypothetical protein